MNLKENNDNLKDLKFLKDKLFISGTCITDTVCNESSEIFLNKESFKPEEPTKLVPVFGMRLNEDILNPADNKYYNLKEDEEKYNQLSNEIYNNAPHFNYFVQVYDSTNNFIIRDRTLIEGYFSSGEKFFNYENFYVLDLELMINNKKYLELILKFFAQHPTELRYTFIDRMNEAPYDQVQLMPGYDILIKYLKESSLSLAGDLDIEDLENSSNEPEFIKHFTDNYKFFVDIYSIYKNSINNDIYSPTSKHKLAFTVLSVYHYII